MPKQTKPMTTIASEVEKEREKIAKKLKSSIDWWVVNKHDCDKGECGLIYRLYDFVNQLRGRGKHEKS